MNYLIFLVYIASLGFTKETSVIGAQMGGNEDLKLIYQNYKIQESQLDEIEYGMTCDGDFPKPKDQKAVRADIKKKLVTKDFAIPDNSFISFCNGKVQIISSSGEISIWSYKCNTRVEAEGYSYELDKEMYSCTLNERMTIDGIELPSALKVVFNKKRLICFYTKENEEPVVVGGVKITSSDAYSIKNKKVVKIKSCTP